MAMRSAASSTTRRRGSPHSTQCFMSSELRDNNGNNKESDAASNQEETNLGPPSPQSFWQSWMARIQSEYAKRPPPMQVDDLDLVLFDIFLICNLVVSIDFWVVHRMQFGTNLAAAVNEGCLLSLCWLGAGLWNGAFLYSAVDGHWPSTDERAGPPAAARLAVHTFVNTINLRLLLALGTAIVQHRPALEPVGAEALLPLELGLGLVLMPLWRLLHSSYTPRL